MKESETEKKLKAAGRLLMMDEISWKTYEDVRALAKGHNEKIDAALAKVSDAVKTLKSVHKGDTIALSEKAANKIPETSEKKQKRKKALLFFITSWKKLRGEVKRAIKTLETDTSVSSEQSASSVTQAGSLMAKAKGPLGLITLIAVGIAAVVVTLNNVGREVVITNDGCEPLIPSVRLPVKIPGIHLPTEPIADGERAVAIIPPLSFTVDNGSGDTIVLRALNFTLGFSLDGGGNDVTFNGGSLLGRVTTIRLSERQQHEVVISCSSRLVR
jgi:hypothetical protein